MQRLIKDSAQSIALSYEWHKVQYPTSHHPHFAHHWQSHHEYCQFRPWLPGGHGTDHGGTESGEQQGRGTAGELPREAVIGRGNRFGRDRAGRRVDHGGDRRDFGAREFGMVRLVRRVVELGRAARASSSVRTRQPLARALISASGWGSLPAELVAEVASELYGIEAKDAGGKPFVQEAIKLAVFCRIMV